MNSPKSSTFPIARHGTVALLLFALFSMVYARADTPVSGTYAINGKPVQLKYAKEGEK